MDAWKRILVLSMGGALGVNVRYWLGIAMVRWTGPRFPWGTITINVTGSFAIGFLAVILAHHWPHPLGRLFVVTGFLGGYTTFSSFSYESFKLWEDDQKRFAAANTLGSVAAGLVAVALGVSLARSMTAAVAAIDPKPTDAHRAIAERSEVKHLPPERFLDGDSGHD